MESDKMYYVPNITELWCGYQCEVKIINKLDSVGYWKQVKIGDIGQGTEIIPITKFRNLKKNNRIRTKYLDEEDIISLGFARGGGVADGGTKIYYLGKNIMMYALHPSNKQEIQINWVKKDVDIIIDTLYSGYCSSINELNKILKLLKIK